MFQHEHKGCSKEKVEQVQQILSDSLERREKRVEQGSRLDEAQFKKFEPLVEDVRKDSRAAMFGFFLISTRRVTMLLMAMYVHRMRWGQLQLFITLNMVSLTF